MIMYKLLIAVRDKEELSGVRWLISKYSFHVERIDTASHVGDVIDHLVDRDKEELSGVKWLISKYSFPVEKIETASHVGEVIDQLENINPDILCIELDMISEDKWSMLKRHIEKYAKQVIAITAESTFERA